MESVGNYGDEIIDYLNYLPLIKFGTPMHSVGFNTVLIFDYNERNQHLNEMKY